jgi:predicted outer membrane repeat protein
MLLNSNVSSNTAAYNGGGIDSGGDLIITGSVVANNTAGYSGGGVASGNFLTVDSSTIMGNTATDYVGGGLEATAGADITNSTFANNSATGNGGGMDVQDGLTLVSCTVASNSAGNFGGGIDAIGGFTIGTTTIVQNAANSAGGIYGPGGELDSSILANYTGGDLSGTVTGSYNLIAEGSGGLSASDNNILGTTSSPIDPWLAPLGYYGGPTQTMPPTYGSPVIGAGPASEGDNDQRVFRSAPLTPPTSAHSKPRPFNIQTPAPWRSPSHSTIPPRSASCRCAMPSTSTTPWG